MKLEDEKKKDGNGNELNLIVGIILPRYHGRALTFTALLILVSKQYLCTFYSGVFQVSRCMCYIATLQGRKL